MPADHDEACERASGEANSAAPAAPPGYAALARRISAWTTNSLLTLVILIAGVGFGRQVLRWWAADAPPSAAAVPSAADVLGDPWQPHLLHFGNQPWAIRRQSIAGDRAAAAAALRRACREGIETAAPPSKQPSETEGHFLASLGRLKPAEESPGKWQLYDLPNGFPMVVGTQTETGKGDSPARAKGTVPFSPGENWDSPRSRKSGQSTVVGTKLAEIPRRVVIWGLAVPVDADMWSTYTFQPESNAGQPNYTISELPVPPDGRRLVAMQVADGGAIMAVSGPDRPDAWKQFYDRWFVEHGWKTAGSWQRVGASWYGRYTTSDHQQPGAADIRFGPDGRGQCTGLLMTSISRKQTP